MSAGLVAATALANAESSARETAETERRRHADRVANEMMDLRRHSRSTSHVAHASGASSVMQPGGPGQSTCSSRR